MALGESGVHRKLMEQPCVYVELVMYSAATSVDGNTSTSLIWTHWQRFIENSSITLGPPTNENDLLNSIINNSIIVPSSGGIMGKNGTKHMAFVCVCVSVCDGESLMPVYIFLHLNTSITECVEKRKWCWKKSNWHSFHSSCSYLLH